MMMHFLSSKPILSFLNFHPFSFWLRDNYSLYISGYEYMTQSYHQTHVKKQKESRTWEQTPNEITGQKIKIKEEVNVALVLPWWFRKKKKTIICSTVKKEWNKHNFYWKVTTHHLRFLSFKPQAILYGCRSCSWSPSSTCYHHQETETRFWQSINTKEYLSITDLVIFWMNDTLFDLSSCRIWSTSKQARRSGLFRHHVVVWLQLRTKGSKHFLCSIHWEST